LRRSVLLLAALAAAVLAGVARADGSVALVAYSTPTVAFGNLVAAFQKTSAGRDVSFTQSYAGSEVQARAIIAGQPADVVNFSHEGDMLTLEKAKLVSRYTMVSRSVVVFVLRTGNPKKIRNWNDLIEPGVDVVTANPFTSGGARWNILAAYGAQLRAGKTHRQAVAYLNTLFRHVVSQDTSARNALNTFRSGRGDVLITYENEAILANQPYVIPKATIQIENPIAVLDKSSNKATARAFVDFALSKAGQKIWAESGYRPVDLATFRAYRKQFPPRPQLFTARYVGGWTKVQKQFFDPRTGIMAKIEQGLGVSTGG
jgi:sulfate/thiosulfate transport system substrate-binding protein